MKWNSLQVIWRTGICLLKSSWDTLLHYHQHSSIIPISLNNFCSSYCLSMVKLRKRAHTMTASWRNIYSYDFCFFSCAKSQVKCILVLNIFFIVNNSKFLSQKNIYRVRLMLKTMLGNIQLPSYWTLCFKKLTL